MKNKWKDIIFWISITIGIIFIIFLYYFVNNFLQTRNTIPEVCSDKKCFNVEIADTPAEREEWLMYREAMSDTHGMLFIFPHPDFQNFRMKNTLIPLDIIRIDNQFKVVRILPAQPCKEDPCGVYKPEVFASYVLEINAGMAQEYGISEWSSLVFKNIK